MNLLARILSHGFAFAVVALIILVLIYRGDLFEEWDLPDFLAIKDKPVVTDDSGAGAVDREPATLIESGDDAAASGAPVADTAEPEPAEPAAAETDETPTADTVPADVTDTVPEAVPDTPPQTDAESAEPAAAETDETPTADTAPADVTDTVPEAVPDTPAETDAEPAPEPAAVAEPVPVVETEPVDTEAAAPRAAEAEDTATREAGDDSAVAAPATGEDEQAAPEAAIEDSQDAASAPFAAADSPSEPAASADASSATTDVAAEQPAEEPAETMAPPAMETSALTAATDDSQGVAETQETPADVEPATAAADTTATDTGESETPYNVLAKAREAYWLRDFATAEQQYKKLTQLEPANPDGYGELGNMYFSRGMWDEAANAYYEAGVRLLDEGLIVQARQMVDVIRGLNGNQADELDARINTATTSSP